MINSFDFKNVRAWWRPAGDIEGRFITVASTESTYQGGSDRPSFAVFGYHASDLIRCVAQFTTRRDDGAYAETAYLVCCTRDGFMNEPVRVGNQHAFPGDVFVFRLAATYNGGVMRFVNMRGRDDIIGLIVAQAALDALRNKHKRRLTSVFEVEEAGGQSDGEGGAGVNTDTDDDVEVDNLDDESEIEADDEVL